MSISGRRVRTVLVAGLMAVPLAGLAGAAGADGATVPVAPTSAVAAPSNAAAVVSWAAPASDGGSPITGYVVTTYQGGGSKALKSQVFNSTALQQRIAGLHNAKTYSFKIAAQNAVGTGPQSRKAGPIVVGAPRKPGQPKVVRVKSGVLRITFAIPTNNGAKILYYSGTCLAADHHTASNLYGTGSPITSSTEEPGTVYTCTVKAHNSRGLGPSSAPSLPVKA
jgi:hypothetical protein